MLWYSKRQDTGRGEGWYGTVDVKIQAARRGMLWYSKRQDTGRSEGCYGTVDVKIQAAATDAVVQWT